MTVPSLELCHAYRHLYRGLLRAVLYARPARYVARDRLRNAFRNGTPTDYDPVRIARTLQLLEGARKRGTEHRLVKNVLRVWGEQWRLKYKSAQYVQCGGCASRMADPA